MIELTRCGAPDNDRDKCICCGKCSDVCLKKALVLL